MLRPPKIEGSMGRFVERVWFSVEVASVGTVKRSRVLNPRCSSQYDPS